MRGALRAVLHQEAQGKGLLWPDDEDVAKRVSAVIEGLSRKDIEAAIHGLPATLKEKDQAGGIDKVVTVSNPAFVAVCDEGVEREDQRLPPLCKLAQVKADAAQNAREGGRRPWLLRRMRLPLGRARGPSTRAEPSIANRMM